MPYTSDPRFSYRSWFTGAILPVCGLEVLVVVVAPVIVIDRNEAALYFTAFQMRFGRVVVLMSQDPATCVPTYCGPAPIVATLAKLPFEMIPWQRMLYRVPKPAPFFLPIPPERPPDPSSDELDAEDRDGARGGHETPKYPSSIEELAVTNIFNPDRSAGASAQVSNAPGANAPGANAPGVNATRVNGPRVNAPRVERGTAKNGSNGADVDMRVTSDGRAGRRARAQSSQPSSLQRLASSQSWSSPQSANLSLSPQSANSSLPPQSSQPSSSPQAASQPSSSPQPASQPLPVLSSPSPWQSSSAPLPVLWSTSQRSSSTHNEATSELTRKRAGQSMAASRDTKPKPSQSVTFDETTTYCRIESEDVIETDAP